MDLEAVRAASFRQGRFGGISRLVSNEVEVRTEATRYTCPHRALSELIEARFTHPVEVEDSPLKARSHLNEVEVDRWIENGFGSCQGGIRNCY